MKKNILLKIIFITLIFIVLLSFSYTQQAYIDTGFYDPKEVKTSDAGAIFVIGQNLWGVLTNLSVVVAVVTIAIIGLKYMFGSVEQKAEYKSTLIPWGIGVLMVAMLTTFLEIIQNFAAKI